MSDIMDVIKQYFDSFINRGVDTKGYKIFKKYGKNINANKFLEEYLISKNSISTTYDYETNQVKNEAIWIKYLLKEYNRYKFRKRNVKLNEEFKRKIVMYHKIGGGIDANSQTPWCSSFVNWILDVSGIGSFKTASSQQMINKLKRIDKPLYGSILIFTKYNKNNEATGHGHITFLMGITDDKKQYICLGGNQEREIKYSKYYLDKKMGVKGGYFKLNGIFWPPDYPDDKIEEIK
ncbi:TIGR02594 family protein [Streptobacillus moniliformis]|uniref:TIGR02594 family protein n=1 Tax=Streptobacillus moniliformis TaxID=34105 RepID=UPI0007E374BE|nr:TIGR02594 family protein [Streptobacillus moniliformis]